MKKTRIMTVCDGIWTGTGFSEEMRNVLFRLAQTEQYEIMWVSLQHSGYDVNVPDTMFPDIPHLNSHIRVLGGMGGNLGWHQYIRHFKKWNPDIVFNIGDPHHFQPYVEQNMRTPVTLMGYVTLDGLPVHPSWKNVFTGLDFGYGMTRWAYNAYTNAGFKLNGYIHHGVNWEWYATSEERKRKLKASVGIDPDTVLFINWDTNQFRKRHDALLRSWREAHPERKNMKLFLNTDTACRLGIDLHFAVEQYDVPRETIIFPEDLSPIGEKKYFDAAEDPFFHKMMCEMGDVYVSATGGEGFGKCPLEGQSLGMPVIITDYSACPEVCEKGSIKIPIVGTYRPRDEVKLVDLGLIDEEAFTDAIVYLYDHPEERKSMGAEAREWAKSFDYDTAIMPSWEKIFSRINPDAILADKLLGYVT